MRKMYIKGFDENLICRGYQFEIGKIYDTGAKDDELQLCTDKVFHFCRTIQQVHDYYLCYKKIKNRFCEIEVLGGLVEDDQKCGSNKIKIVREIKDDELERMLNSGCCNIGCFNSGDYNSGDNNSGDYNSGDYNSGDNNSGDYNSGDYNLGNYNSGCCNIGCFNSGDNNSGDYNLGNYNSGDYNTGNFNKCDFSTGFFNTKERTITIFNKDSGMTHEEFRNSKYMNALTSKPLILNEWIKYSNKENIGGYLKTYTYKKACKNWWNKLTKINKKIIMSIPNFDKEIFKEITGIEVEEY